MTHGTVVITDSWEAYYLRRRLVGCICFWIWFIIVIIITGSSVGGSVGGSSDDSDSTNANTYFYGQTQIVSSDINFLCESIQVGFYSYNGDVTLYALTKAPTLKFTNNFTLFNEQYKDVDEYTSWKYYLHEGSVISASVCRQDPKSTASRFLLIQGDANYREWKRAGEGGWVARGFTIPDSCGSSSTFTYTIPPGQDGVWYFVIDNDIYDSDFNVDILLYTKQYRIDRRYIDDQCSPNFYDDTCQLSATKGISYVVVVGSPSYPYDYTDTLKVAVGCVTNVGILATIIVVPIVVVICCCTALSVTIVCLLVRRRKKNLPARQGQARPQTTVTRRVVTVAQATVVQPQTPSDRVPILTNAPPPAYQPAPSNFQKPPDYQPAPANYGTVQQA